MLEQRLSPTLQRCFFTPIAKKLQTKLHANHLTLLGLGVGLLFIPLLLLGFPILALFCLGLSGLFDCLDGELARLTNASSPFGTVLDIMCDRVVEISVILALFLVDPNTRGLASLGMLSTILLCITSFLVTGIFSEKASNKSFYYSPGLIERAETFLFFGVMVLLPTHFINLAYLYSALVLYTTLKRLAEFKESHQCLH